MIRETITWVKNTYTTPSAEVLALRELEDAKRALLEAQTGERVGVNPWMKDAFDAEEKTDLPPGEDEAFRASMEEMKRRRDERSFLDDRRDK